MVFSVTPTTTAARINTRPNHSALHRASFGILSVYVKLRFATDLSAVVQFFKPFQAPVADSKIHTKMVYFPPVFVD